MPGTAYWHTAVAEVNPLSINGLWNPLSKIDKDTPIVTAGSCFAQHIGMALAKAGYNWLITEPAPRLVPRQLYKKYGYGIFSFRTGNIYTVALLKQWLSWALNKEEMPEEIWEENGRFYDPFRPNIEPTGFASPEELFSLRQSTLAAIQRAAKEAGLWIFTLGLTEAWGNSAGGYYYPICPGTVAGHFESLSHTFHNFRYAEIYNDIIESFTMIRNINENIKFILTVSPVPLTASASGNHVLVANEYSKSTLRAVAEDVKHDMDNVDYFPAYEIVTGFPFRGLFFEPNLRSVSSHGVEFVMKSFFGSLYNKFPSDPTEEKTLMEATAFRQGDDIACEEALLKAFREKII
ncbi:hypothetical protein MTYM_02195 [Methylococcales bacterium]|nr:hypothetical protein MTYM_02195 [Methylococcales bacterium]